MGFLLSKYLSSEQRVAGLDVCLLSDGKVAMQLVQLLLKRDLISIEKRVAGLFEMENLKRHLSPGTGVCLSIHGKGILNKKVAAAPGVALHTLAHDALPNANLSEFYMQSYQTGQTFFLSIARKNVLDLLLEQFAAHGFPVVSVSLGPFCICSVFPMLELRDGLLNFAGHQMQLSDGNLQEYMFKESPKTDAVIHLADEAIPSVEILAYAAAFQMLSGQSGQASVAMERVDLQREELRQQHLFKRIGWAVLSFFLLVLLANFGFFDHYSKANARLLSKEESYRGLLTKIDTLEKQVKEKEQLTAGTGWLTASRISFLTDRLAASVPPTIQLNELSVNPVDEKATKSSKALTFEAGLLKLSGSCKRPTDLNPWIKEVKSFDWVKVVDIQHYTFDYKSGTGNFDILLKVK